MTHFMFLQPLISTINFDYSACHSVIAPHKPQQPQQGVGSLRGEEDSSPCNLSTTSVQHSGCRAPSKTEDVRQ